VLGTLGRFKTFSPFAFPAALDLKLVGIGVVLPAADSLGFRRPADARFSVAVEAVVVPSAFCCTSELSASPAPAVGFEDEDEDEDEDEPLDEFRRWC
jgi:hypothetical protein